eukprot:CAMPEP_0174917136 /NCGR_PEP_ID=MMETSP1355-20121228/2283_1 /TAXON_ID=464990 /ORGANISM="Hemiselmis tepida, Strain CCMP443" /LENGTH=111 /DNA_ID=CAMNT_0016162203 /DNA_START=340 /DNA_END=672 /DNA_ORIENTATION=+
MAQTHEKGWLDGLLEALGCSGSGNQEMVRRSPPLPPAVESVRTEVSRMCHSMANQKAKTPKLKSRHWESNVSAVKGPLAATKGKHSTTMGGSFDTLVDGSFRGSVEPIDTS